MELIAVFSKSWLDLQWIEIKPNQTLVRINRVQDLMGRRFKDVILFPGWNDNIPTLPNGRMAKTDLSDAFESLFNRQPELFRDSSRFERYGDYLVMLK